MTKALHQNEQDTRMDTMPMRCCDSGKVIVVGSGLQQLVSLSHLKLLAHLLTVKGKEDLISTNATRFVTLGVVQLVCH